MSLKSAKYIAANKIYNNDDRNCVKENTDPSRNLNEIVCDGLISDGCNAVVLTRFR